MGLVSRLFFFLYICTYCTRRGETRCHPQHGVRLATRRCSGIAVVRIAVVRIAVVRIAVVTSIERNRSGGQQV